MPDVTYEVPAYTQVAVPDGDRWLLVYQDGDEESAVRNTGDGWFRLGPTSGDWQVASSADLPVTMVEATRA